MISAVYNRSGYLLLYTVMIAAALVMHIAYEPNLDISWLIYCIDQMRAGKMIYRDLSEVNPPLILLLYYPFVVLSDVLHVDVYIVIKYVTIAGALISAGVSRHVLRHSSLYRAREVADTLTLAILAAFLFVPHPYAAFSQREHWFFILILPYVMTWLPSMGPLPRHVRIITAVLAAVGFCIKPYFFITWLAIQGFHAWRHRSFRVCVNTGNAIIIGAALLYLGVIAYYFPAYLHTLPLLMKTYPYYGKSLATTLVTLFLYMDIAGIVIVLCKPWQLSPLRQDMMYLATIAAAMLIQVLFQFKTWGYLAAPLYSMLFLILAWSVVRDAPSQTTWRKISLGLLVAFFVYSLPPIGNTQADALAELRHIITRDSKDSPQTSLFVFSSASWPGFSLMRDMKWQWASRYPSLWMLHAVYKEETVNTGLAINTVVYNRRAQTENMEKYVAATLYDDLEHAKPKWIIFDTSPRNFLRDRTFDFEKWAAQDERLRRFLQSYQPYEKINLCGGCQMLTCSYDVYKRTDSHEASQLHEGHAHAHSAYASHPRTGG